MKKGFTLIELMIVIAIIAILFAIVAPHFIEPHKEDKNSIEIVDENLFEDNSSQFQGKY